MTLVRRRGDSGQAFPIYITVVAGLLFLALAYLAVGQAAANRNGAQTAADAAALAAALEARDQLAQAWAEDVLDPTKWQDIFNGTGPAVDACWRAYDLAAVNDATANGCGHPDGPLSFEVTVTAAEAVGDSIVPGTEGMKSTASAKAVIESRCTYPPAEEPADDALPELTCDGEVWELDPEDLDELPKPEDLFDVHLAD
ncbi:pilus assembly protein TadG-related protein [Streptomyces sp. NPDC096205]|uniref:pilus assembly protein TadG-related protein n=1 Tax=Streptomyces sp. NPDC096205 TaxID=3366081 RepID=UPI00381A4C82